MPDKKTDLGVVSYAFGIISIVLAFFQPIAGLVFGIIGLIQSKRYKSDVSEKAKKFSIIGIILSIIVLIISIAMILFDFSGTGIDNITGLPA